MHQGTDAVIGQQLKQHRMRHLAVEDDDTLDPLIERVDACLHLRDHAAGNGPVGNELARVGD